MQRIPIKRVPLGKPYSMDRFFSMSPSTLKSNDLDAEGPCHYKNNFLGCILGNLYEHLLIDGQKYVEDSTVYSKSFDSVKCWTRRGTFGSVII